MALINKPKPWSIDAAMRATRKKLKALGLTMTPEELKTGAITAAGHLKIEKIEGLTGWDVGMIMKALGFSPHHRVPRCPAKSGKQVEALRAAGEPWHGDAKHAPCDRCSCRMTAGKGTNHVNTGWCYIHAKSMGRRGHEWSFAMMHEQAMKTRNPGLYADFNRYAEETHRKGKDAQGRVDLLNEVEALRALLKEVHSGLNDDRVGLTDGYDPEGVPRRMTDGSRFRLIAKLAESVSRLTLTDFRIHQDGAISRDEFMVWIAKLAETVKKQAPDDEFKRVFKNIMAAAGDPTRKAKPINNWAGKQDPVEKQVNAVEAEAMKAEG